MATNNQGSKSAREAAAAARAKAKAEQQARDRKIAIIGTVIVVAVVGILGVVGYVSVKKQNEIPAGPLPAGVTNDTYGIKIGPAWTAANAESIPKLQLWEDFQCPACGAMERSSGAAVMQLADEGKLRLEWRPTIFLDERLKTENTAAGNPESSLTATVALGCAVDAGRGEPYHSAVFALQPAKEGTGFSTEQLLGAASQVGIAGQDLNTFESCLTSKKYESWVKNSYAKFNSEGVSSTPTGVLNGKALDQQLLFDPQALTQAITDAAK